jgi:NADH:ubiquinone oxidoreductase subunit 2 (subunit N)
LSAIDSLPFAYSELILVGAFLAVSVLDFFIQSKKLLGWASFIFLVIAFLAGPAFYPDETLFFNYYIWDPLTFFFKAAAYFAVGLTILASLTYRQIPEKAQGEYYALLLVMALLLTIMGGVTNLLTVFLAIESVSLTSYILVGFQKFDKFSSEASLKYLLFGSVASAVMLFGMSLIFGMTGTLDLEKISAAILQVQSADSCRNRLQNFYGSLPFVGA